MNLQVHLDPAIPLPDAINQLLRPLIGPFKATTAPVTGNNGQTTETYSTIVHNNGNEPSAVPVDNVAAVIDCYDALTVENLEAAYQRIKAVKSLQKTDRAEHPAGEIRMTTGIVVARSSDLTLEQISSEVSRLNGSIPSHYWPDAVAVLSIGLVNYSAHVPGSEKSGDFFLPAEPTASRLPAPSIWIQQVIRPAGDITINKVASLILRRVAIFQPGTQLPDDRELIESMPSHGVATQAYQFNLAKTLVAMTKEQAIAAQFPQDTFNIISGKKNLGSVQYQSWQDGGIFVVRGAFPLDLFLILLNEVVPGLSAANLQYFRGSGVQVSYVLPVNRTQFFQTLSVFERRSSNISIQRETSKILVQNVGDEGSASPFVARLMIGMMKIRDSVYEDKAGRAHFDNLYEALLSGLRNARETGKDIGKEWELHRAKVESGAIVSTNGRMVRIGENIDRSLKHDLENFLNTTVRTIKHLQVLTEDLRTDIGFLFRKESSFQAGITKMRVSDPSLADYLLAARQWSEPLVLKRNNLEHGTIPSPKVSYVLDSHPVRAKEPRFDGRPITEFTNDVIDRICCFVEEITVSCLRKKLPRNLEITEVPLADRNPSAPERFQLTVTPGGREPWELEAHTRKFAET